MLKNIFKNKKILNIILIVIFLLIIAIGSIVFIFKGFNYDLMYDSNNQVEIYFEKSIEKTEVNKLLKDIFETNKIRVQKINESEKYLLLTIKELTQKQKELLTQKMNEINKENQITIDDLIIYKNERVNLIENYNKYFTPIIISLIVIIIYLLIKYNKIGKIKIIFYTIGSIILAQLIYISIIIITRTPINFLTIPIALMIFFLNILVLTNVLENKNEKQLFENKKNNKK